jgi:nucleoside-diphosphate-sugar epimerase
VAAIAITGATGFLGGTLARRLLGLGQPVLALGRDPAKLADLAALGARTMACDLSAGIPQSAEQSVEALVHCAALSSAWGPREAFRAANVGGTHHAILLARKLGARRFVHVSTPSIYFRFRDQEQVREDAALPPPVNAYAETKRAAEALVLAAGDLDPVILRPRGIYGAGDTALLPRLLRAARTGPLPLVRGGTARTDLTHVEDAASAILASLKLPLSPHKRIFNISGGEPLTIRQIAEQAAGYAGATLRWRTVPAGALLTTARALELAARLHPGQPEPRITAYSAGLFAFSQTLDLSAARAHLGWSPRISFEEGLARTFGDRA